MGLLAAGWAPGGLRADMAPGAPGDGVADLYVGGRALILQPDGPAVNGFILTSDAGRLVGEPYASGLGVFVTAGPGMIADQLGFAAAGLHDLGNVLPPETRSLAEWSADLTMTYTLAGREGVYAATILPVQPGDADLDGTVNAGDLDALEFAFGKATGATWTDCDFTGDGAVDHLDYLSLWSGPLSGSPSTQGTPEPNALALFWGAALATIPRRRGRRTRPR